MKNWITQKGEKIPFDKLTDSHLLNILKHIKKMSKEGVCVQSGGVCDGEPWYEEDVLYGKDALWRLDYYELKKIAKQRGLLAAEQKLNLSF